jgi:CRISPR-associated protein Cmr5
VDKRKIDELILKAYGVLESVGIVGEDGKINSTWRGQISSFGVSIAQGGLLAAVSFFSAKGRSSINRELLMKGIFELIDDKKDSDKLFAYVKETDPRIAKENILNAAVALKLAMNLYELEKECKTNGKSEEKNGKSEENEPELPAEQSVLR